ncbi:MAG: hypothetical protein J5663_11510 [Bacteroidaceae bacterium]|nr:hypothetical protein [Bacteroidaceae bacterium]
MKKIHILSLGLAWMLGLASYAQEKSEIYQGLKYTYSINDGYFTNADAMGTLEVVDFELDGEESETGDISGDLGESPVKSGASEIFMTIYADGFIRITGRQVCYKPTGITVDDNASVSSAVHLGNFEVPESSGGVELSDEIVTFNTESGRYEVNDPYRMYWAFYNIALRYDGHEFCRGSEIDVDVDANSTPISHDKYQDELFYEKIGGNYYPVTLVYLEGLNGTAYPIQFVGSTKKFVVNEYPADLLNGRGFQEVNVGASVSVLPSFTQSNVNKFIVDEQNANYTSVYVNGGNNSVLCAKDADGKPVSVVALPKLQNNTITLPYEVSSINEGALPDGVLGVKVVTPNADLDNNESNLVDWIEGENNDVNSLKKDIPLTLTKSPLSVLASYMKQKAEKSSFGFISSSAQSVKVDEFKKYLSELANTSELSYIDLSNCTFNTNNLGSVDLSGINANCLLFLPEGVTATGDNIITMSNGVRSCAKLKLVRQSGVSFANPYEFTATEVSVDYSVGGNMVGLVLPFDYSNGNLFFATFNGYNEGYLEFNNAVTEVLANTPFLTCTREGVSASQKITASNVTVKQTPTADATSFSNGWAMNGTYLTVTNDGNSNCTIYGFASNKLRKSNGATFKPFTGYFVCDNSVPAANEAKFRFVSDATTGVDSSESIFAVKAQNGVISVIASGENVVIASVNGAVLFNGKVNGSLTKEVNPGVYVVNGKKVVVNK